jgi:hypothetical protein
LAAIAYKDLENWLPYGHKAYAAWIPPLPSFSVSSYKS